ncbi:hypothetical protein L6164_020944 [Bauhinia variegata]|uniref:Uncharacterized protein n=1 Tax=Bauhinia variegata TaxID=167791 RepID=A0ACB9N084_BAUVA|nr:hypothetical protein L6164_020944 [Bauhinia variegata]
MSSAGEIKQFCCYKCDRTVVVSVSASSSEPLCPLCNQGFVEELENPNPNNSLNPTHLAEGFDPLSFLPLLSPSTSTVVDFQNPRLFSHASASGSRSSTRSDSDMFDPYVFLQNRLRDLQASGTSFQFEINNLSEAGFGLPANIGDYFLGPGLEQLIQQLAENDPNRYGTPPASKSAIENLPTITVSDELLDSEMNQCAVCQDEFEKDTQVKQMPCKHVYHDGCLIPWLELHNSCPVCRYELPTNDPDYENQTHRAQENTGAGSRVMKGLGKYGRRYGLKLREGQRWTEDGQEKEIRGIRLSCCFVSEYGNVGSNRFWPDLNEAMCCHKMRASRQQFFQSAFPPTMRGIVYGHSGKLESIFCS